jgi:hypothetical protein
MAMDKEMEERVSRSAHAAFAKRIQATMPDHARLYCDHGYYIGVMGPAPGIPKDCKECISGIAHEGPGDQSDRGDGQSGPGDPGAEHRLR